jgi:hypothetical protein
LPSGPAHNCRRVGVLWVAGSSPYGIGPARSLSSSLRLVCVCGPRKELTSDERQRGGGSDAARACESVLFRSEGRCRGVAVGHENSGDVTGIRPWVYFRYVTVIMAWVSNGLKTRDTNSG